jgi:hypothetical protein
MEVTVITGQDGKIIGTARLAQNGDPAAGSGGPIAGPGQSVRVINLPSEFENIKDAEELHRQLEGFIASR